MKKGFLIYEEMRKLLVIYEETVRYDFATAPFWISLYMRKIKFSFFISVLFAYLNLIFYSIRKILFKNYYLCTTDDDEETYLRESQTEPINNQKVHYVYLSMYSIVGFPLAF